MKSPLAIYNETAKKFKITDEKQLHHRQKLAFINEQVQSMQVVSHRLLCDIVTTKLALDEAKDESTKAAIQGKITEYENNLRQTSIGLEYHIALQTELNEEFNQSGEEA